MNSTQGVNIFDKDYLNYFFSSTSFAIICRDNILIQSDKSFMNFTENARFFIVYPLDLEDLGLQELTEKFSIHFAGQTQVETFTIIKKVPGGLEIECPFLIGISLNTLLRTPTRILLRLGEFKCRDAPKLFQKISKFNWAPWLIGQIPEVESATSNSRLFDSRKIEKAIQDGVLQYYRHKPLKKKYLEHLTAVNKNGGVLPKIYFRAVDDTCTLSLDTTGERLHLRGEKNLLALAPIRENLAALLLRELKRHLLTKPFTLIDPMCGSGTFLLEAYRDHYVTKEREFSFNHLPLVLDNYLKLKNFVSTPQQDFSALMGFDINKNVTYQAQINCTGTNISISNADLFDGKTINSENTAVIINPPYGVRVGEKSEINLAYYLKIIEAVKNKFNPIFLGIIIPIDYQLKSNKLFKIKSIRTFKNGGIEVVFYILTFLSPDL